MEHSQNEERKWKKASSRAIACSVSSYASSMASSPTKHNFYKLTEQGLLQEQDFDFKAWKIPGKNPELIQGLSCDIILQMPIGSSVRFKQQEGHNDPDIAHLCQLT